MRYLISIFVSLPIIFLFFPIFTGKIILGGEGLFTINYSAFFVKFFSFWFNDGFGHPNVLYNFIGLPQILFLIFENYNISLRIINLFYFFILIILPFIGFFLLSFQISKKFTLSITLSSFYCFNAFSISYLSSLNITNASSLASIPFLLYIYYKYFSSKYLYLIFGIVAFCFSYSFYNPPTFIVIFLSLILFIPLLYFIKGIKFDFIKVFIDSFKLSLIFIIFNIWWLVPTLLSLGDASSLMTKNFALDWEASTHQYANKIFLDILFLNHFRYLSSISSFNIYSLTIITYLLFLSYLIIYLDYKNKKNIYLISILFILIFFIKGTMPPLGIIYEYLLKYLPFFWIMKSPIEKFSIPFIFYLSILILLFFNGSNLKNSIKNISYLIISIFIAFPYIIFKDKIFYDTTFRDGELYKSSRYVNINSNHIDMINFINNLDINGRILIIPQHLNYQSMIKLDDSNNVYTGLSYIQENIRHQILRHDHFIYKNYSSDIFYLDKILDFNFLHIFAIEYILVNNDLINWYGLIDNIDLKKHKSSFEHIITIDNLELFKVKKNIGKISIPSAVINLNNVN